MPSFSVFPLGPPLQQAADDLGFVEMTPIQEQALPHLLAGRDVVGQARTGSGKTAAFGLPMLERLRIDERAVQALVLCPTRELAAQVTEDLRSFGKRLPGLRVVTVTGGRPQGPEVRTLQAGAHVVVGTPGRTLDHLRRGSLDVERVGYVVLDEADRMLDLGFSEEVTGILEALPVERQTALFSATFPDSIASLSARWQRDAVRIVVESAATELVAHGVVIPEDRKPEAVGRLLIALQPESALVFRNQKRAAAELADALVANGFDAAALHGDLEQDDRDRVMAQFRGGSIRVLVATDVAARGLDVAGLDLVVNCDLPYDKDVYLHRVGRTGRAGRPGLAWTLATSREAPHLSAIAAASAPLRVHDGLPDAARDAGPLVGRFTTLRLGSGRKDKLRPGDVLGALTGAVGLPGTDIGRIEILDRCAFVAVARAAARAAAKGLVEHGIKGRRVRVETLRGP